jgi:choline dehydrogenase-like flavoprotein
VSHAPGAASEVADEFFDNPQVRVINLIGGVKTARILAEPAGRTLKRLVLDLGGYNPMIVLDDVDLDYAVRTATFGCFFHQGQICLNTRHVIVQRKIYDEFITRFVARTRTRDAGYLSTDHDLEATLRGIEVCRDLGRQQGFDPARAEEVIPGRSLDKAALQDFARNAAISFGHPVGTCKMWGDEMIVVGPQLRVHGVKGLSVCDSSIMPSIVTCPTSAASHMIGAKAAHMILATV